MTDEIMEELERLEQIESRLKKLPGSPWHKHDSFGIECETCGEWQHVCDIDCPHEDGTEYSSFQMQVCGIESLCEPATDFIANSPDDVEFMLNYIRAQQAEIAAMKLALIPFSEMYAEAVKYAAAELAGPYSDFDKPWESRPTFGDLRRAAQALESTERGERE